MTKQKAIKEVAKTKKRDALPKLEFGESNVITVCSSDEEQLKRLFNVKDVRTANGLGMSAITAAGSVSKDTTKMMLAMPIEMQPRDALEAMLITQMAATHIGMTSLSGRMLDAQNYEVRDKYNLMMTRLSRTFCVQVDTLKKYRAKASQTVRVERVEVKDGGQAIVGDVTHTGGGKAENER